MESKVDCRYEPISPTPKLSLYSFPSKKTESPGMTTPPIHSLASVPFQWEEAPGKPRPCTTHSSDKPKPARCLELPPRLLIEARVVNMPSPTTVLDGPYMGRSLSVGKGRFVDGSETGRRVSKAKSMFGSSRWGSFRKHNKEVVLDDDHRSSSDGVGGTKVKITRIKRISSFMSFSNKRSHLWTNIHENLKQVVRWRRQQEKPSQRDGEGSPSA